MISDATRPRLTSLLAGQDVVLAYHLTPLPKGILSAARGGLTVLFASTTTGSQRYEQAQRLRFQLMGLLPPGHGEVIVLNDCPLPVAAAAVERGTLLYCQQETVRLEYEMLVLTQVLDFDEAARRFLGP